MPSQLWNAVKLAEQFRKKLRKPKAASTFNDCVGGKMKGKTGSRTDIRKAFKEAAKSCKK